MPARYDGRRLKSYIGSLSQRADGAAEQTAHKLVENTSARIEAVGAVDTGELRDSPEITGQGKGWREVTVQAEHGAPVNYGHKTRDGEGFVEARPFWEPALMDTRDEMPAIARENFKP